MAKTFFVVGGAGFIGSNFVNHLLQGESDEQVVVFDNFSSGRRWHVRPHVDNPHFRLVEGEASDTDALRKAMKGSDVVLHLASNPDIARAAIEPDIDFWSGSALTQSVLEAMRRSGVGTILYVSGSGVYGDLGEQEGVEDTIALRPGSPYGASKIAGEALVSAYVAMFGLTGASFRFGNVVGPRQTHGVGLDFVRSLLKDPRHLRILGDGGQSKSYIHVKDITNALLTVANRLSPGDYEIYNVATGDYITVSEIAELAVAAAGLQKEDVAFTYTGGRAGWKGDVPIVRLNTARIQSVGWRCSLPTREAIRSSLASLVEEAALLFGDPAQ